MSEESEPYGAGKVEQALLQLDRERAGYKLCAAIALVKYAAGNAWEDEEPPGLSSWELLGLYEILCDVRKLITSQSDLKKKEL